MSKFNYRHKTWTLNKALEPTGHRISHIMVSGKDCYILSEKYGKGWRTCGYYYSASDAAEITNTLLTKHKGV